MYYTPQTISCKPDSSENKALRKYYFRLAWIIIALIFVFSILNTMILTLSAGMIGGGFTKEAISAGKAVIRSTPVMKAIYSYGFPIAGDIAALGIGILITKCDFRKKITFSGFTGGDLCRYTALSFGIVTVASFVNLTLLAIIKAIFGSLNDLSINDAVAVSTAPVGNPLWLDVCIYLYICLIGPILEELIFRGVLLEGLRKYGNAFGIIISSVMFGLMHQNFMQCIPAVFMGIIWAVMDLKCGSLIPSIFVHILNNSLSAILMILMQNTNLSDMTNIDALISSAAPLLITMLLNILFRFACMIIACVIIMRYFSGGNRPVEQSEYCRCRTWKYLFTSLPWLLAIAYMLYETVTSIPI